MKHQALFFGKVNVKKIIIKNKIKVSCAAILLGS